MTWDASLMRLPKGMTLSEMAEKYGNDFRLPSLMSSNMILSKEMLLTASMQMKQTGASGRERLAERSRIGERSPNGG